MPESGIFDNSRYLTFGRPPHRRFWRGCAAHLAGVEADPESGRWTAWTNCPGHSARKTHLYGMERKAGAASFFTERTLAAYLAVSDRTIRNWIRRGELPSYMLGAARRIDPVDVEEFLSRRKEGAV